jgi:hypothetical protein
LSLRADVTGLVALLTGGLLLGATPLLASESELEEAPPPKHVEEIGGRVEREFEPQPKPGLRVLAPDALADLPPFLRDATYRVQLRSRYWNQRRFDDDRVETWAGGGSFQFQSGWWQEIAALELEYFTSQKLKGDSDRDGARYLEPGQHGFGVLGVANLKLRYEQWSLTAYRQQLDLPYLNGNDSRMVPNTFEAATAKYDGDDFGLIGGYTWRIKLRDSDEFESFPETQGVDKNRGIGFLAFKFDPTPTTYAGVFGYYGPDLGTVVYSEGSWIRELTREVVGHLEGQFTHASRSGEALLAGGEDLTTWFVGVRASASWKGWLASLATTHVDGSGPLISRFGSNPSYLDRMQASFTRAGEDALGLDLSYDLAELGLRGFSVNGNVTQGWGGEDVAGERSDRLESNLTIDYRPPDGAWSGLWLRLRGSLLYDDEEDRTQNELRIEFQYEFDLF